MNLKKMKVCKSEQLRTVFARKTEKHLTVLIIFTTSVIFVIKFKTQRARFRGGSTSTFARDFIFEFGARVSSTFDPSCAFLVILLCITSNNRPRLCGLAKKK